MAKVSTPLLFFFFLPNVCTLRIEDIVGLITDVRSPVCIKPSATVSVALQRRQRF